MKAHGDYGEVVYRVIDKEEYAIAFLKGSIRFSSLKYYKHIEDISRNNVTEGDAHVISSFLCFAWEYILVKDKTK